MKLSDFDVWFSNENYEPQKVRVIAMNASEAIILAQAKRIQRGLDYTVCKISKVS